MTQSCPGRVGIPGQVPPRTSCGHVMALWRRCHRFAHGRKAIGARLSRQPAVAIRWGLPGRPPSPAGRRAMPLIKLGGRYSKKVHKFFFEFILQKILHIFCAICVFSFFFDGPCCPPLPPFFTPKNKNEEVQGRQKNWKKINLST